MDSNTLIEFQKRQIRELEKQVSNLSQHIDSLERVMACSGDNPTCDYHEVRAVLEKTEHCLNLLHWIHKASPDTTVRFSGISPVKFSIMGTYGSSTITGTGFTPLTAFIQGCNKYMIHRNLGDSKKLEEDQGEGHF